MISHGKNIKIFSGNSHPALAMQIASALGLPIGKAAISTFADGEISVSISESVRGSDVFLVQSTCGPVNNNRMELLGAIEGLRALKRPSQVELISDSKYLVDAFNQHWIDSWLKKNWKRGKNEDVKNVDLWKRLLKAKEQHQVSFHWVKGHADNPLNERCDQLATSAADGNDLYVDEGINGLQK